MTAQDVIENLRKDKGISSKDQEKAVAIIEANSAFVEEILNDREHSSEEKSYAIQNLLNEDWEEPIDQSQTAYAFSSLDGIQSVLSSPWVEQTQHDINTAPSNADRENG